VTADRDITPGNGVWNMVKDGKSIGWNAFTLAGVKSASDFGEMPAAGGVSRRHRVVSPEILAVSPVHFVDSAVQLLYSAFQLAYSTVQLLVSHGQLACSPAQLSNSPAQLSGSPGHFSISRGVLERSPGRLDTPNASETAYFEKFRRFHPFAASQKQ